MTIEELNRLDIITEHGVFSPKHSSKYDPVKKEYIDFKIIKTAEEVYDEWLENKNKAIPQPKTIEQLTKENEQLWDTVQFLLKYNEVI